MISRIKAQLMGEGIRGRALRGTLSSILLVGGSQFVRFASNLVLTRLLFPEAFGLMALVQVIVMGLEMLSTFGLRISVMQNARGDEPDFLNTAWTLQAIRGFLLWLLVCLLAPSFASFYNQPILAQILPVASFSLVIRGFFSTNVLSVQRHLQLGRYSMLTLLSQVINVIVLTLLAYWMGTVWALVIGGLISTAITLVLFSLYLPGIRNRFRLEGAAVREILKLGKYLFISTIATYVINQSDRAVLGLFIPIDLLGIYGIAFALATLPAVLATTIAKSVVFPLYRMRHPADSPENQAKIFWTRRMVASAATVLSCGMAYGGPWIMDLLYDNRYALAGPITVLLCVANIPLIVLNGTMNAALSKGDSMRFMIMNVATAICQLGTVYIAVQSFSIAGAALAIGLAPLLTYPLLVVFLRRYQNWDPVGELGLMGIGFLVTGGAVWFHWDRILLLMA